MLDTSQRFAYNEEHAMFRDTVRKVFADHMEPNLDDHEKNGIVPREAWKALGEAGMLCPTIKEENGGLGLDFGYCAIVGEEMSYMGSAAGFTLQNDITANYFERLGTEEQRQKYLPGMVSTLNLPSISVMPPVTSSGSRILCNTKVAYSNGCPLSLSKTVPVILIGSLAGALSVL